ncbi:nuclear transport factor 2 family protein [Telluribacter humicola]|uniref:nuclear transport factor 2 family protein n=1 Tax=Telluribacter humicola TaxID=1720261 RepID=UPI001A95F44E|nr:nuclear transport factor 2 family protein [Telluribacter humicola]
METIKTENLTDLTRKGTCIEFFSAYQEMDLERMINLAAPEATVWFKPLGEDGKGLFREFGKTVWSLLMDSFPDLDNTVDTITTEGDEIICKVSIFGTQKKDFLGLPAKGLRFESDHIFIFHFDEADRIQHLRINWDHDSFVNQLSSK